MNEVRQATIDDIHGGALISTTPIPDTSFEQAIRNDRRIRLESYWIKRAQMLGLNPGSKKYMDEENSFFAGLMYGIQDMDPASAMSTSLSKQIPPIWAINGMSGRPIVDIKEVRDGIKTLERGGSIYPRVEEVVSKPTGS